MTNAQMEAILAKHDLSYLTVVANKNEYETLSVKGVYFLLKGSEIVFVGQSTDVLIRIAQHWAQKEKQFDAYYIVECPVSEFNLVQAYFIYKFKPLHNNSLPSQEMFKSLSQINSIFDTNLTQIKKFIRLNGIEDRNGFYKLSDFEDL